MTQKQLTGIAGVYFVAGELSKKGYIALTTSRNTESYDLLVFNPKTKKSIPIQVKSTNQQRENYLDDGYLGEKINQENIDNDLKFIDTAFVYVYFTLDGKTRYFIIPLNVHKEILKKRWNEYINESKHRKSIEEIKKNLKPIGPWLKHLKEYENKWDLLGLD